MKVRMLAAGTLAIAGALALPASAMAGEVKGPSTYPDGGQNFNYTGALDHANSICAASGLNDMDPSFPDQTASRVQTAADAFKYYGLPPQIIGQLCRGGSGE